MNVVDLGGRGSLSTPFEFTSQSSRILQKRAQIGPHGLFHGRPVVLRYSVKEIERAFQRI